MVKCVVQLDNISTLLYNQVMSLAHQLNAGRPSVLDDEQIVLKIKELYLQGNNEKEIAAILDIPYDTWGYWKWKNYKGFTDKLLSYKHERMILKAEANLETAISSDDEKIRLDASKFTLETLAKKNYSKRTENTGIDGKDLPTQIVIIKPDSLPEPVDIEPNDSTTDTNNQTVQSIGVSI